jgi:hypothetical protein
MLRELDELVQAGALGPAQRAGSSICVQLCLPQGVEAEVILPGHPPQRVSGQFEASVRV